jgi:hypothetical protein
MNLRPYYERESLIWEADISATQTLVLLCINSFAGADGKCFPSYRTIAHKCKISRTAAINAVKDLEKKGILKKNARWKESQGDKGLEQSSNSFEVEFDGLSSQRSLPGVVNQVDQVVKHVDQGSQPSLLGGKRSLPGVVNQVDPGGQRSLPKLIQLTDPFLIDPINTHTIASEFSEPPEPPEPVTATLPVNREHGPEVIEQPNGCSGDKYSARLDAAKAAEVSQWSAALPDWRNGRGPNGIKPELVEYLHQKYLPSLACNKGKSVSVADAKQWVLTRERSGQEDTVQVRWDASVEWKSASQVSQQKQVQSTDDIAYPFGEGPPIPEMSDEEKQRRKEQAKDLRRKFEERKAKERGNCADVDEAFMARMARNQL